MPIRELAICGYFDQQRFKQFSPEDAANWFLVSNARAKKPLAMYPAMGRKHINFLGVNRLIFVQEPRAIFKTINYYYIVVANGIFRYDKFFNEVEISQGKIVTLAGKMFSSYITFPGTTFVGFVDGQKIYVYREETGSFDVITDPNAPANPKYIATFGNRFVVSSADTSQYGVSQVNLGGGSYSAASAFTISGSAQFAQEAGIIRQMGVLHNTLYIFTDYTTGNWANIPSVLSSGGSSGTFPFKKNTSYDWDYGMAVDTSLSIGFNMMCWLGQNADGLFQVLMSSGQAPKPISTKAVDVLLQVAADEDMINPFKNDANGFLYQYENTVFYRLSAGQYDGNEILNNRLTAASIEFNFDAESWNRDIELNGERNRIQKHIYFNDRHLVTVQDDGTVYEMSGQFYTNDIRNDAQTNPQLPDAYVEYPFRYERVTQIISEDDYAEFETEYVEIDFVWGIQSSINSTTPFLNAIFMIDEVAGVGGEPVYIVDESAEPKFLLSEEGNTPTLADDHYHALFKPHIELYWSDDGGMSFLPADVREFSQLGFYSWRMRWYQLGVSRNRVYKLIAVSPSPIVVLGAVMSVRRMSNGAN